MWSHWLWLKYILDLSEGNSNLVCCFIQFSHLSIFSRSKCTMGKWQHFQLCSMISFLHQTGNMTEVDKYCGVDKCFWVYTKWNLHLKDLQNRKPWIWIRRFHDTNIWFPCVVAGSPLGSDLYIPLSYTRHSLSQSRYQALRQGPHSYERESSPVSCREKVKHWQQTSTEHLLMHI